ncbi:MAG TPA: LamG domain-containing protein, partial [Gemmataceae bacterium]|nr:LamG domain-containing protein [Gemmataceae bacterium]
SADYFAVFADRLAKRIAGPGGKEPVVIMSQGTSGDLMWMDYGKPEVKRKIGDYADGLAEIAFGAYRKIEYRDAADLAMRETKLTLDRRAPDAERLKWARERLAKLAGKKPTEQPDIYAREAVFLHEEPRRELKLQAVRIGGFGLAAIPNEVFAITGLRIKAQSPLEPTAVIELANGAEGYIPPPAQHALGGYTTWPARSAALEVQAEPKIAEAVLGLLEGVSGQKRRLHVEPGGLQAEAVKERKPVAYWRLDEFHGPRATDAMGRHHATYEDGVAHYLEGPGDRNRCGHFAGGRVRATLKVLGERYSVEMWVWNGLPASARAVTGYFFSRGPDGAKGAPGDHLGIGGTHLHAGRLIFNGNDRNRVLGGKTALGFGEWHHVVLVRDGTSVTVYLDGKPEMTGEADVTVPAGEGTVFVGGRSDNFANFAGKIDEVAVYDRALSAEELKGRGK